MSKRNKGATRPRQNIIQTNSFGTQESVVRIILWAATLTTIFILPKISFDPINAPKLFVLSIGGTTLLAMLCFYSSLRVAFGYFSITWLILFVLVSSIVIVKSKTNWSQELWGDWGRNTGALYYFFLLLLCLATWRFHSSDFEKKFVVIFSKLSYFILFYSIIQLLDLDPIPWSQRAPFATLGNINFSSAFLGFASILFFWRACFGEVEVLAKFFFLGLIAVNIYVIWTSGSIQGLVMFILGVSIQIVLWLWKNKPRVISVSTFLIICITGVFIAYSALGNGPISSKISQETLIYRIDYWKAGLKMFMSEPIFGIGIDSYGDHYREFRTIEAVLRTGPQRTSNTAHNIFIDILSSGGLVYFLPIACLFFLGIIMSFKSLRLKRFGDVTILFISLTTAFVVFCMISINQIGVGVWGFVFLGLLLGRLGADARQQLNIFEKPDKDFLAKTSNSSGRVSNTKQIGVITTGLFLGVIVSILPLSRDIQFWSQGSAKNQIGQIGTSLSLGSTDFHRERLIYELESTGNLDLALSLARKQVALNPRSFEAWSFLWVYRARLPEQIALQASRTLRSLDPNNVDLAALLNTETP